MVLRWVCRLVRTTDRAKDARTETPTDSRSAPEKVPPMVLRWVCRLVRTTDRAKDVKRAPSSEKVNRSVRTVPRVGEKS